MSGLIKELLLDLSLNKVSVDLRSDLIIAIQDAFYSGVLKPRDIIYLDKYLQGYTSEEIAAMFVGSSESIDNELARIFKTIEEFSGYTDESFMRKVSLNTVNRRSKLKDLRVLLQSHGLTFTEHELKG